MRHLSLGRDCIVGKIRRNCIAHFIRCSLYGSTREARSTRATTDSPRRDAGDVEGKGLPPCTVDLLEQISRH